MCGDFFACDRVRRRDGLTTTITLPRIDGGDDRASNDFMSFTEVLLLAIRWLHAVAAVAWVGGGIFYFLVLRPAIKSSSAQDETSYAEVGQRFRHLVGTAMAVLIITGAVLTISRLTSEHGGLPYIVVLAIKVSMALYMFYLARFHLRSGRIAESGEQPGRFRKVYGLATGTTAVLVLGVIIFLLADILAGLVEQSLKS